MVAPSPVDLDLSFDVVVLALKHVETLVRQGPASQQGLDVVNHHLPERKSNTSATHTTAREGSIVMFRCTYSAAAALIVEYAPHHTRQYGCRSGPPPALSSFADGLQLALEPHGECSAFDPTLYLNSSFLVQYVIYVLVLVWVPPS